jgi:hypothetical protein
MTPRPAAVRVLARIRSTAPPETAVLTAEQLATWLQISPRQVDRLAGIPWVTFGARSRRALVRSVLAWLETQAKNGGRS